MRVVGGGQSGDYTISRHCPHFGGSGGKTSTPVGKPGRSQNLYEFSLSLIARIDGITRTCRVAPPGLSGWGSSLPQG